MSMKLHSFHITQLKINPLFFSITLAIIITKSKQKKQAMLPQFHIITYKISPKCKKLLDKYKLS